MDARKFYRFWIALVSAILVCAYLLSACGTPAKPATTVVATATQAAPPTAIPTEPPAASPTPIPPTPTATTVFDPFTAEKFNFAEIKAIETTGERLETVALSPDGTLLAYASSSENTIHLLDAATGKEVLALDGHTAPVVVLVFNLDGSLLASTNAPFDTPDGTVRVWDVKTGVQQMLFNTDGTYNLAFSPDSKILAGYVSKQKKIVVWDLEKGAESAVLEGLFGQMSISPAGLLAAGSETDNNIHLYNLTSGDQAQFTGGHTGKIWTTAISPDGKVLASGSEDTSIGIWEISSGVKTLTLSGHIGGIESLAFSPNGNLLASLGSGVLWTVSGGQVTVNRVGEDRFVRFWNLGTGKSIAALHGSAEIVAVSFSADWSVIVTGDMLGKIQFWKIVP